MAAEQVVTELVIDDSDVDAARARVVTAFDHMGARAEAAQAKFDKMIDGQLRIGGAVPQALERVDAAYARLQGRLDPVIAAQQRMEREMVQSLGVINRAVQLGVATEEQAARDISRLKQQQIEYINRVRDAQVAANNVVRMQVGANDNEAIFRRRNLTYQAFDVGQSLAGGINPAMVAIQQGPQIAQIYAGQGGVNAALKDTLGLLGTIATRFGPIAVAAGLGAAAIASMRDEIEATTGKTLTFGETAVGVFRVIASDITRLLQPAIDTIAPPIEYAFEKLGSAAVDLAEWTVNAFRMAGADIAFVWEQLPNIAGAAAIGAMNAMTTAIGTAMQFASDQIDKLIEAVNGLLAGLGQITGTELQIPKIGFNPGALSIPNPYAEQLAAANAEHARRQQEIAASNPIRGYLGSIGRRVGAGASTGGLPETMDAPRFRGVDDMPDYAKAGINAAKELQKAQKEQIDAYNKGVLENREAFRGFIGDIYAGIRAGDDIGEILSKAAGNLADRIASKQMDALAAAIFPTIDQSGAGSIATAIGSALGLGSNPAAQAVGAMNVTAATVIVNGGVGGALAGLAGMLGSPDFKANTTLEQVLGLAKSDASDIIRMPLGRIGQTAPQMLSGIGSPGNLSRVSAWRDAIASIESAGSGDYGALGPINARMGQALGRYQIMEANLPSWSRAALGRNVGRKEFMANPGIQDAIFDHRFGGYVDRFGEKGAAQAWFGGPGSVGKLGRTDVLGTSVGRYGELFETALQKSAKQLETLTGTAAQAGQGLGHLGQGFDAFGSALSKFPSAPAQGGGGFGGFFSKIFGMFGGGGFTPWEMSYFNSHVGAWADGGFTGIGGRMEPAGIVHRGEYVVDAAATRALGVPFLDSLRSSARRGFSDGGLVPIPTSIRSPERYDGPWLTGRPPTQSAPSVNVRNQTTVINNAPVDVRTEERDDGEGGTRTDIIIEARVANAISRRGSAANKAMVKMGFSRPMKMRG